MKKELSGRNLMCEFRITVTKASARLTVNITGDLFYLYEEFDTIQTSQKIQGEWNKLMSPQLNELLESGPCISSFSLRIVHYQHYVGFKPQTLYGIALDCYKNNFPGACERINKL